MILPFTVLRRLDCVLEATKPAVLAELARRGAGGMSYCKVIPPYRFLITWHPPGKAPDQAEPAEASTGNVITIRALLACYWMSV